MTIPSIIHANNFNHLLGLKHLEDKYKKEQNMNKPYMSFVVVGRNDNYGYKFLERFQNFLNNLTYLCEKNRLNSELIIVDWNPPNENKKLHEVLKIKEDRKYLEIKFIEVPHKIHKTFKKCKEFPLFEYIGKNVGVRRSQGEFILVTNPDIIFSDEIIKRFSEMRLKNENFYVATRNDLSLNFYEEPSLKKIEKFITSSHGFVSIYYPVLKNITKNFLSFLRFFKYLLFPIFNFKKYGYIWYMWGTPGDFTLLSKKGWHKIGGYPELPLHGKIDNYGIYLARLNGLKRKVFKEKIYHQEHTRILGQRKKGYNTFKKNIINLMQYKNVFPINGQWGLNNVSLKEILK